MEPASKRVCGQESVDLAAGSGWQAGGAARVTHRDEGVGFPVGRGDLVRQPRRDSLGRLDAELRHRLGHKVHPIQETLRRVTVVLQEAV